MVKRCGGLPLAIKALAGMLQSKESEQQWQNIHYSEIWTSQDVLPSLRLWYDNLPYPSLKRCFVYCSIIPKDTRIHKDELIQIWMALGFLLPELPPLGSGALMEDIGCEFFNILLWHSLLQDIQRDEFGNIKSCKMHDLVHDLALSLSKHRSVTVKTGLELNHVSKAAYLRIDKQVSDGNPKILKRDLEQVRFLYAGAYVYRDVLPYITHLTVLVLNIYRGREKDALELPRSLQNMKYIKHLDISRPGWKIPIYITELYNLQTLRVWELEELPKKFCNLINLRHLYIKKFDVRKCMFNGIERLTCLQTLPPFVVKKDKNCLIEQLEGLNNLRGKVNLYGLSDVGNMQEASKAKLCAKSNIDGLLLNWKSDKVESVIKTEEDDVLKGLEPNTNLKELIIEYFIGRRLASWITKMKNLVNIKLSNCRRCEELPPLGHLLNLREMELERMDNIRIIGSHVGLASNCGKPTMYPSLKKLILKDLPKLEEWTEPDMGRFSKDQSCAQVFPKLEKLIIDRCSKLTRMPDSFFPSLKDLRINDSNMMIQEPMITKVSSLRSLQFRNMHISDVVFEEFCSNNSESLRKMKLSECQGFTCLTVGAALEELNVEGCLEITSTNAVKDDTLSLRSLQIRERPSLSAFAKISHAIKNLEIILCDGLTCVTVDAALEKLIVYRCPDITSISAVKDEILSLRSVHVQECPSLSVIDQSVSSTIKLLHIDEITMRNIGNSFPNLTELMMYGLARPAQSLEGRLEFDDPRVSAFSAVTSLHVAYFEGLKQLPDTIAKLPPLQNLHIMYCEKLKSLPTFEQSHTIRSLKIICCPILEERYVKEKGVK